MTHASDQTEILLRPWRQDDAARLIELAANDSGLLHQIHRVSSLEEAQATIAQEYCVNDSAMVWCLEKDGLASGQVGISYSGQGENSRFDRGWVWYWAAENIRGRRIMKPVVRAICDYAQGLVEVPKHLETPTGAVDISALLETESPHLRRLELGYRTNNPASRALALSIGFVEEGIEREKFNYDGELFDAAIAGRLVSDIGRDKWQDDVIRPAIHHVELWTRDFASSYSGWEWMMTQLGFSTGNSWAKGVSWVASDGSYVVLEESPDVSGKQVRTHAGMNHLALNASQDTILHIREQAEINGWLELFADKFPHAGGENHYALYLENIEGFELELVAEP